MTLISSTNDLIDALKAATGGETILLDPQAEFEPLALGDLGFVNPVLVRGGGTTLKPRLPGLRLRSCANIEFRNIHFDYTAKSGDMTWTRPFSISRCVGVRFVRCDFEGDTAKETIAGKDLFEGYFIGTGLDVTDCDQTLVSKCSISRFFRGLEISGCTNTRIVRNHISGISSDGMVCPENQRISIIGNTIRNFLVHPKAATHPDMIQFWTTSTTKPGEDILIKSNVLDMADGNWTQSIFMRNERVDTGDAGDDMFYRNVQILRNVIRNNHYHGITVGEAHGVRIEGNRVIPRVTTEKLKDNPAPMPSINIAGRCTDVAVVDNEAAIGDPLAGNFPPAWHVLNNHPHHSQGGLP